MPHLYCHDLEEDRVGIGGNALLPVMALVADTTTVLGPLERWERSFIKRDSKA
jgi:hypothetical protein